MRRLVLLLAPVFLFGPSSAQDDPEYNKAVTRLIFKASYVDIGLNDLNTTLRQSGFETFDNVSNFEFSLVTQSLHKRWGTTWSFIQIRADENDVYTLDPSTNRLKNRTLKGWGLKLSEDYYLWQDNLWKLYVPINLQWMKYSLTTFEDIPVGFHLNNSRGVTENRYTSWRPSVESGLNLETGIRAREVIFVLGINLGYRLDYGRQDWKYNDEISIGFPTVKNQGFVFGISLGISPARRVRGPRQM